MRMGGLRVKFILSFFILLTIPMIVLGYLSYTKASTTLQDAVEGELISTTKLTAELKDQVLETTEDYITALSKTPVLADALTNLNEENRIAAYQYLAEMRKENGELLENLLLVNNDAKVIITDTSQNENQDLSDRDYVKEALRGSNSKSEILVSK
ncbi:MAG: hypothetical protein CVU87_12755, partial [Firmicutes bacterium HGW-Firmicutes-12]